MNIGNKILTKPIIQGGMGVGISLGNLAGNVALNGGMGVISTANPGYKEENFWKDSMGANTKGLKNEVSKAKDISKGNGLIGVNIMVALEDYDYLVKLSIESGVDAIISGAGLPLSLPKLVEGSDVLIAPIISSGRAAAVICKIWIKKYNRKPDFIVIEGSKAGGHLGFTKEELVNGTAKSLDVLLEEVKDAVKPYGEIPIFVAGGISNADHVDHFIKKGASGVQVATRFIATEECDASLEYKKILINAKEEDIIIVKSPVGMPGRALKSPLVEKINEGDRVAPTRCIDCIVPCDPRDTLYCISSALIDGANGKWETGLFFCGADAKDLKEITTVKSVMDELLSKTL
ncbi:MAG: NAD(P)H-dependent flavin oxidoreductase [Oscillospiraceae bacterium]